MRDNFNFNIIPMVQDSHMTTVRTATSISNGYYGYQAPPYNSNKEEIAPQEPHSIDMEVQFAPPTQNRKRCWDCSNDFWEFKKRRQNESNRLNKNPPITAIHRDVNLRTPTHNVPDMPRCLMGHYI